MTNITCPSCNTEFEAEDWESGDCPGCGKAFWNPKKHRIYCEGQKVADRGLEVYNSTPKELGPFTKKLLNLFSIFRKDKP